MPPRGSTRCSISPVKFPTRHCAIRSSNMAMANSLCFTAATPFPITASSKQSPTQLARLCVARQPISSLKLTVSLSRPAVVAAAAASTAEAEKSSQAAAPAKVLPFRVGHGFDLHRLEPGYPLIIGGIDVPHDRGCEAHSDGDVLLHCVVDAILGALGLPDIGQIFPDTDPKWKGAASSVFVKEAVRLMHEAGYELGNLDSTLILQKPKLSPHKEAIRENLCQLLGADPSIVNLKAKTHEKVDSLGENRSIAAHTVVLLVRK